MITIDYSGATYIINVPKSYTQFVSTDPITGLETRQMNLTIFAQDLADLQDDSDGMWAPTAFEYTAPISVGGVQLAPVVVILSPYVVQFEDLQYAVNLVGANTNLQDVTIVNQVSVRPNNSAGLTFSDEINIQSFQDASVWIDTVDGLAGTQYPRGTPSDPVNNATDASTIANRINFHKFRLKGTINATGVYSTTRYVVTGDNPLDSIVIATNLDVEKSGFEKVGIVGSITGRGSFQDCSIGKTLNLTGVEGIFDNCGIAGNLTLDATATEPIVFKDCVSAIAGTARPIINCNGTAAGINFRRYAGGLAITNFNNANGTMTLDLMGADVSIDSATCTDGEIVVRGNGRVTDENGVVIANGDSVINGSLNIRNLAVWNGNVDATAVVDNAAIATAVWTQLTANNTTPGSTGVALNEVVAKLYELWQMDGLDSSNPVSITPTQKSSGTIDITIGGDGETLSTLNRQ